MDALDLTQAPPRSARAQLADLNLLMAARTVDKLRASLPGGDLGTYKMAGFSTRLLEALGISEDALRTVVAQAASDAEIATWMRANSDSHQYEAINAAMEERIIAQYLEDPGFFERYPLFKRLSPQLPLIDALDEDDRHMFSNASATERPS
jgi:hypothetical protein